MKLMKLKPIDIRVGDYIYTGYTGKKKWRRVSEIIVQSAYRYTLIMNSWNLSSGSCCEFLVKGVRNNTF